MRIIVADNVLFGGQMMIGSMMMTNVADNQFWMANNHREHDDYRSWQRVIGWQIITGNMVMTTVADNELFYGR